MSSWPRQKMKSVLKGILLRLFVEFLMELIEWLKANSGDGDG